MKRLSFILLPPVGSHESSIEGTVTDLLLAIPYLLVTHIVPPLAVLNEVLATGESNAGMSGGCRWEPFSLTPSEFEEVVTYFAERGDDRYARYVEPPEWVGTFEEWRHWTFEYCYDIPAKHSLEVSRKLTRLETAKAEAEALGDHELAGQILSQMTEISIDYSEWMLRHRKPHVWERES